jgi:dual oxidase
MFVFAAIGHLTGSFLYSSRPAQREAVIVATGVHRSYRQYVALLPGWTGISALCIFYLIALLSMPVIRKKHYEIFQLGHLLMYPFIGLVCAHGSLAILQYPMLGFWLIIPALLIIVERSVRVGYGFYQIPAKLEILDGETVAISVVVPQKRYWKYRAGQYVFITVPELSTFQWHPFTISTCIGNDMQLHIKTDGDWTSKLRQMAGENGQANIRICIDGPFGAPAQRFYEFDYSIIIGSGIGVTPFSGILTDLQAREERYRRQLSPASSRTHIDHGESTPHESNPTEKPTKQKAEQPVYRRVDFHWIVKDKNYLLWFSNLLNSISRSALAETSDDIPHLDIRLQTHVTQKRKNISTHIYRYLLELHRTDEHPESPLTGLINETHFGRPDLAEIMNDHYESMLKTIKETKEKGMEIKKRRVGVFFCGAPPIGLVMLLLQSLSCYFILFER